MNAEERQRLKRIMEFTAGLAVTVCLIVLIFFRTEIFTKGLSRAVGILTPFVYGAVIAYLLHPACSVLERWLLRAEKRICKKEHPGLRRMLSILLVLAPAGGYLGDLDGAAVLTNLVNGAHAAGLGSCWINRPQFMFETNEGRDMLRRWGIEGNWKGVGSVALGYAAAPPADPKPRKENYCYIVK